MSANRRKPHIYVLPEDEADRELARGFELVVASRQFQVLPPAGGWLAVLERFNVDEAADMRRWRPNRHLVLLIDFDRDGDRLAYAKTKIPDDLKEQVYILGSWMTPEKLKAAIGGPTNR